jgi:hypothetical protein
MHGCLEMKIIVSSDAYDQYCNECNELNWLIDNDIQINIYKEKKYILGVVLYF